MAFTRTHATRTLIVLAAIVLAAVSSTSATTPTAHADNAHRIDFVIGGQGTRGSVTFIGDSVGIGAGRFSPTLPDNLVAAGWGPVRFHAVDGKRTGLQPGWQDTTNANITIDQWHAQGYDSDAWIINLGANDSGWCKVDLQCARTAIMLVVDAIGPGHQIWWPKITKFPTSPSLEHQQTWNQALDEIAAERTDFFTWDWATEMRSKPDVYGSWDQIHLYPDAYVIRSAVMAAEFTAALADSVRIGADAALPDPTRPALAMTAVDPQRLVDTRLSTTPLANTAIEIDLDKVVPASAGAVAVNLTAAYPSAPGFLTGYDCGTKPAVSTVTYQSTTRAAGAIVPLSPRRSICVYTSAATEILVDLQAVLVPVGEPAAALLTPLPVPKRLIDTRNSGRADVVRVAVGDVQLAAVNLTVTGSIGPGFLAAYPCDATAPEVSNVNFGPGETVAAAGFVGVGDDGAICVASSTPADVIVDLTATLSDPSDLSTPSSAGAGLAFVPVTPTRMLDTRDATGGWSGHQGAGQVLDVGVAPAGAVAVSGTVTVVAPVGPSFLSVSPCATTTPDTSSVNASARGLVVANAVTTTAVAGRVCIAARTSGHTLFDVTGWWTPPPV